MLEREQLIGERHQQCTELKEKLLLGLEIKETEIRKLLAEYQAQNKGRKQPMGRDFRKKSEEDEDVFSSSGSSSSSSSSGSSSSGSSSSRSSSSSSDGQRGTFSHPSGEEEEEDQDFAIMQDGKVKKTVKPRAPAQQVSTVPQPQLIQYLQEIESVIVKRSLLEEWIDTKINDFIKTFKGYFVKCYFQQKERIAEIVDARDEDQDRNPLPVYTLGKHKTGIQVLLKYGPTKAWFRLDRISNKDPTQDDFSRMLAMFKSVIRDKDGKVLKNEISSIYQDNIKIKAAQLVKIKKQGPPQYKPEEKEEMTNQNLERRLKDGRSDTINLPYERTRIEGDIGYLQRVLDNLRPGNKDFQEIQLKLAHLQRLYDMVNKASMKQIERNTRTMTVENGAKRSIEEVENELQEREWLQTQQFKMNHPEIRQNNFFMQQVGAGALQREASLTLKKQDSLMAKPSDSNNLTLEDQLARINVIEQRFAEESKALTFYERQKRLIDANKEYNEKYLSTLPFLQTENIQQMLQNSGGKGHIATIQPHPKWHEAWENKMTEEAMKAPQTARFISFEQYFNQA